MLGTRWSLPLTRKIITILKIFLKIFLLVLMILLMFLLTIQLMFLLMILLMILLILLLTRVTVRRGTECGALDPVAAFSAGLSTRHTFKTPSSSSSSS